MQIIPATSEIKFKISGIQSKITRHAERQENAAYDEERNQSVKADPDMMQMLELAPKILKLLF